MKKIVTHSETETRKLAVKLAKTLKGGEVIGLIGDLGSGKTAFVKGLAQGLGIKKRISSPTFVLMKVYPVKHKTIKHFVHIDAYRIKKAKVLTDIGLEDYSEAKDVVVVIEWADLVKKLLPKNIIHMEFIHMNNTLRTILYENRI